MVGHPADDPAREQRIAVVAGERVRGVGAERPRDGHGEQQESERSPDYLRSFHLAEERTAGQRAPATGLSWLADRERR